MTYRSRVAMRARYVLLITLVVCALPAIAEEGSSGHYFPGSLASFMDGVSSEPALIARVNFIGYSGSIDASRQVPIAGLTALDVTVDSSALGLTVFWAPRWGKLSNKLNYAMSATLPLLEIDVTANVVPGQIGVATRRGDSKSGVGDFILMPVMLNYQANPDFNMNLRLTVYAPTGSYQVGRLANTGKNFWTIEPVIGLMYFGQQTGVEASLFMGVDFNSENNDTDYKSGTQAHMDGTLAQHFPLWGGLAGAGATGYWYRQIEGDTGAGARLGAFKARAAGLGPAVSWVKDVARGELLTELKWLHEFSVTNRPEGDILFLKAMYKFY